MRNENCEEWTKGTLVVDGVIGAGVDSAIDESSEISSSEPPSSEPPSSELHEEFVLAEIYGFHCLMTAAGFEGFPDDLLKALHVKILGRRQWADLNKIGPIRSVEKLRGRFRKRVGRVSRLKNRLQAEMDFDRRMKKKRRGG